MNVGRRGGVDPAGGRGPCLPRTRPRVLFSRAVSLPLAQTVLAQAAAAPALDPATLFYLTLLVIFLTAVVTAVLTRWARDKCLVLFRGYHVTLTKHRGPTVWGELKVFSSGVEVVYDHPFTDLRGHRKTSQLFYQQDLDSTVLALLRFHDELDADDRITREKQVRRAFNPGPFKRAWRCFRNLVNALRDAINTAIGAAVTQFSRTSPAGSVLASQAGAVNQLGAALTGRFGNAYEPLLEQYIGRPVILDVADPINPNNTTAQFAGFLADYTGQWIALLNAGHMVRETVAVQLPDLERGDPLPPLPPPPPPGAPAPVLPPAIRSEAGFDVRLDGPRFKLLNTRDKPVVVRRLERSGLEPVEFGTTLMPRATFDLPARDARGGTLVIDVLDCVDVLAPRKYAVVRHAGTSVPPRSLLEELHLDELPKVPSKLRGVMHTDVKDLLR